MITTKRIIGITAVFLVINGSLAAQDSSFVVHKQYRETAFAAGYNYNFGDKVDGERPQSLHFAELAVWRTAGSVAGHHPVSFTYYGGSEIGLNTERFTIAPKVGGFVSVMIMGLGAELAYYTDFDSGSLRFIPYIGATCRYFKLTVNPHVVVSNKEFMGLNAGSVSLVVRLAAIRRVEEVMK